MTKRVWHQVCGCRNKMWLEPESWCLTSLAVILQWALASLSWIYWLHVICDSSVCHTEWNFRGSLENRGGTTRTKKRSENNKTFFSQPAYSKPYSLPLQKGEQSDVNISNMRPIFQHWLTILSALCQHYRGITAHLQAIKLDRALFHKRLANPHEEVWMCCFISL